ncbi:hypothetical protein C8F04DRAFT_1180316 [Mycena alexandri]|uniref:Uncharacterized protein n=1 Tax=Mycena alexandri TaxID=1745969 RepID=A0AAD6T1D7_9AGAR|nr:hypothetical protein C8F04DRAFT_1180316 [Mycena alexandri]
MAFSATTACALTGASSCFVVSSMHYISHLILFSILRIPTFTTSTTSTAIMVALSLIAYFLPSPPVHRERCDRVVWVFSRPFFIGTIATFFFCFLILATGPFLASSASTAYTVNVAARTFLVSADRVIAEKVTRLLNYHAVLFFWHLRVHRICAGHVLSRRADRLLAVYSKYLSPLLGVPRIHCSINFGIPPSTVCTATVAAVSFLVGSNGVVDIFHSTSCLASHAPPTSPASTVYSVIMAVLSLLVGTDGVYSSAICSAFQARTATTANMISASFLVGSFARYIYFGLQPRQPPGGVICGFFPCVGCGPRGRRFAHCWETVSLKKSVQSPRFCVALMSRWPYPAASRPRWWRPAVPFPLDVWEYLLLTWCDIDGTILDFVRHRDALYASRPEFVALMLSRAIFWTRVYLHCGSSENELAVILVSAGQAALHVEVDLRVTSSSAEFGDNVGALLDPHPNLRSCLATLALTSARWSTLAVRINRPRYYSIAKDFLVSVSAPHLVAATLHSSCASDGALPQILGGMLGALKTLRVLAFPLQWIQHSSLNSLQVLDIRNLALSHHPDQQRFTDILRSVALTLEMLSMGATGMLQSHPFVPSTFDLPRLQRLEMVFLFVDARQTGLLVSVLDAVSAPSLTHLRLEGCDRDSAAHIGTCMSIIRGVTHLSVSGGSEYAQELARCPDTWPHIQTATCAPCALSSFADYATRRAQSNLPQLLYLQCLHHPRLGFQEADEIEIAHLQLLVKKVGRGQLSVCGKAMR